jgi:hypothetical protein
MKVSGKAPRKPCIDVSKAGRHEADRNLTEDDRTTVTKDKEGKRVTIRHGRKQVGRPKKK